VKSEGVVFVSFPSELQAYCRNIFFLLKRTIPNHHRVIGICIPIPRLGQAAPEYVVTLPIVTTEVRLPNAELMSMLMTLEVSSVFVHFCMTIALCLFLKHPISMCIFLIFIRLPPCYSVDDIVCLWSGFTGGAPARA